MVKNLWFRRRAIGGDFIYRTGLGRVYQTLMQPKGCIVLMYHSVTDGTCSDHVDPANCVSVGAFEMQMEFLSRQRNVISFSKLVSMIGNDEIITPGTVCITFDDGYLDNLTVAAPVMQKYGFPATFFLATGYVGRVEPQWIDVLYSTWRHRQRNSINLPEFNLSSIDISGEGSSQSTRNAVHKRLLSADYEQRTALLDAVREQLQPSCPMPRLTLSWDEVRSLRSKFPLMEIGGHTRNHIDLRAVEEDIASAEINGCADDLMREIGERPKFFSYPYGRWNSAVCGQVARSGWVAAVGAGTRFRIDASSDRWTIPRVEAPSDLMAFDFVTSPAFPGSLAMLGLGYK